MLETDLCNLALARIGGAQIQSLDDDTEEARKCKLLMPSVLARVLRSGKWNCALAQAVLARVDNAPLFEFAYRYRLPSDCLRVVSVNSGEYPWRRFQNDILTDCTEAKVEYVRNAPVAQLDELCAESVIILLASRLAISVKGDVSLAKLLMDEFLGDTMDNARFVDATEGKRHLPRRESLWIDAKKAGHHINNEGPSWR